MHAKVYMWMSENSLQIHMGFGDQNIRSSGLAVNTFYPLSCLLGPILFIHNQRAFIWDKMLL